MSADDPLAAFVRARPRLFGIAYRMLGSAADAEDLVQDVWLRWQGADRSGVNDPAAFLATTATRLAINVAQSARVRRESYLGEWLPEPVDTAADPLLGAERAEALEIAVLLLLEKLSPKERAAYVLREAFDYEYAAIAEIIGLTEANVRQLVSRARKHIADGRRTTVSAEEQRRLLDAFVAAAQHGNMTELERLLASDVVSYSDGGGIVHAAMRPVFGRNHVARFVAGFAGHFWRGITQSHVVANGRSALLLARDGVAVALLTIDASVEGISQVVWVMRPSKLAGVAPRQTPSGA